MMLGCGRPYMEERWRIWANQEALVGGGEAITSQALMLRRWLVGSLVIMPKRPSWRLCSLASIGREPAKK